MEESTEGDTWSRLRTVLQAKCSWIGDPELAEDAIQDALVLLATARRDGVGIGDEVGFCLVIVRRRFIDRLRRRREVAGVDLAQVAASERTAMDWVAKLQEAGWQVSQGARELLEQIEGGRRTTKGMARVLGRNVKTIKERRAALVAFLRRVLAESGGIPPPPERPCLQRATHRGIPRARCSSGTRSSDHQHQDLE